VVGMKIGSYSLIGAATIQFLMAAIPSSATLSLLRHTCGSAGGAGTLYRYYLYLLRRHASGDEMEYRERLAKLKERSA